MTLSATDSGRGFLETSEGSGRCRVKFRLADLSTKGKCGARSGSKLGRMDGKMVVADQTGRRRVDREHEQRCGEVDELRAPEKHGRWCQFDSAESARSAVVVGPVRSVRTSAAHSARQERYGEHRPRAPLRDECVCFVRAVEHDDPCDVSFRERLGSSSNENHGPRNHSPHGMEKRPIHASRLASTRGTSSVHAQLRLRVKYLSDSRGAKCHHRRTNHTFVKFFEGRVRRFFGPGERSSHARCCRMLPERVLVDPTFEMFSVGRLHGLLGRPQGAREGGRGGCGRRDYRCWEGRLRNHHVRCCEGRRF